MSRDLHIQISTHYSDWNSINIITDGLDLPANIIRLKMEEVQRYRPEAKVRAADENGRMIDKI